MSDIARIVLMGPMGIGKTTAIRTLCGELAVDCDVVNLDREQNAKETTTVGADFGEVDLGGGARLQIYGCPGQDRFDFVRQWVLSLALGVLIMVDVSHPDSAQRCAECLDEVAASPSAPTAVVLVSRPAGDAAVERFVDEVERRSGTVVPVLHADVRNREQMVEALEILVSMITLSES